MHIANDSHEDAVTNPCITTEVVEPKTTGTKQFKLSLQRKRNARLSDSVSMVKTSRGSKCVKRNSMTFARLSSSVFNEKKTKKKSSLILTKRRMRSNILTSTSRKDMNRKLKTKNKLASNTLNVSNKKTIKGKRAETHPYTKKVVKASYTSEVQIAQSATFISNAFQSEQRCFYESLKHLTKIYIIIKTSKINRSPKRCCQMCAL